MSRTRSALIPLFVLSLLTAACEATLEPAAPDAGERDGGNETMMGEGDHTDNGDDGADDSDDADDSAADDDTVQGDDSDGDDDEPGDISDDTDTPDDDPADPDDDADDSTDDDLVSDDSDADDDVTEDVDCDSEELDITIRANGSIVIRCDGIVLKIIPAPDSPEDDDVTVSDDDDPAAPDDDDTPSSGDDDSPPGDDDEPPPDDDDTVEPEAPTGGLCSPVRALEHLPARHSVVSSNTTVRTPTGVFVDDVFDQFRSHCGSCHVDFSLGNFQVTRNTFTRLVTRQVIQANMGAADRSKVMPPGELLLSERPEGDAVRELYDLLLAWRTAVDPLIQADPNADPAVFFPPQDTTVDPTTSQFLLSPEQGEALTNLGTCIPDAALVNTESTKSLDLDAKFASMTALPKSLSDTDLFTLDSAELARHGVISYAPAYPLFSDDSGKMRHVRVPRGQSLVFDPETQTFQMPENTRFYKTFLKPVTEADGHIGWRKIETRIIVARTDQVMLDGRREPTALYGSYIWDETETVATLTENPLRNGEPFRDVVFRYLVDEANGKKLQDQAPADLDQLLRDKGWARHYAVPGAQRCVDCHRGSDNHSFILGFSPLQVNRLAKDADPNDGVVESLHGLVETPGEDDLTQLQRLIDYGVITGIDDVADVVPLERTQDVAPRNDYELVAQGYMVGNCAICHNPDGLATYENPVLRDVLDFLPDMDGGIFGFPLTGDGAFSPRIRRRAGSPASTATMRIPYITPDLYDRDREMPGEVPKRLSPWRSLIFRNVDTPFDYQDDGALFPHMPRNVGGFDQRLPRIMGDWMVSIPARPLVGVVNSAAEQTYEEVLEDDPDYEDALAAAEERLEAYHEGGRYNCTKYEECLDPAGFETLCEYPCVDTREIVDLDVVEAVRNSTANLVPANRSDNVPARPHWVNTDLTQPSLDEWPPRRPDWYSVLLCGNGRIDQGNPTAGVPGEQCDDGPDGSATCTATCKSISCGQANLTAEQLAECDRDLWHSTGEQDALAVIRDLRLTADFEEMALGERPMTVWAPNSECDFSEDVTVDSYAGSAPAAWLDVFLEVSTDEDPGSLPLYMQSPGEAVFAHICASCHGPQADSQGRQAATVALMSGGETRVANLRDGLLGPGNVEAQFGPYASIDGSALDLAARYVAWMALGGTQRTIPSPVLELVKNVPVYGFRRPSLTQVASPNMLEQGITLCESLIGITDRGVPDLVPERGALASFGGDPNQGATPLLGWTGDFEAWRDLCTYANPPPILVVRGPARTASTTLALKGRFRRESATGRRLYCAEGYCEPGDSELEGPPDLEYPFEGPIQYIGDHNGNSVPVVNGAVDPLNKQPWCVEYPTTPEALALALPFAEKWELAHVGQVFPWCPPGLLEQTLGQYAYLVSGDEERRWTRRGAANAGMAVFAYLRAVSQGLQPKPAYDRCEERQ